MGKILTKMVEQPAGGSAWAKEARQDPELRKYDLEGFELASGFKLPAGAVLAYRVYGEGPKLAVAGTSYGVTHKQVEYHVGQTIDPKVYTFVVFNLMGNGVSYSPSNPGKAGSYPLTPKQGPTIGDNVKAQKMALENDSQFGKKKIDLVYGFSMGGMQALEWARAYPEDVAYSVPVCGSSGCNQINQILCDALASSLTNPLSLKQDKLKVFGLIFAGWYVGPDFYRNKEWSVLGFTSLEEFEANFAIAFWANSDPDDLLAMLHTWRYTEPFSPDVCKAIKGPKVLLLPCSTDTYFRVEDLELLEKAYIPSCSLKVIKSNWGHLAGNPEQLETEFNFIKSELKSFI